MSYVATRPWMPQRHDKCYATTRGSHDTVGTAISLANANADATLSFPAVREPADATDQPTDASRTARRPTNLPTPSQAASALVSTSGREVGSGPKTERLFCRACRSAGWRRPRVRRRHLGPWSGEDSGRHATGDVDHSVIEGELGAGDVSRAVTLLRIGAPGEGSLDGRR